MKYAFAIAASYAAAVSALAIPGPQFKRGTGISITPHDSYSSSIGVLGCHIDTNRVAYWPSAPDCNNMCVKVSANGRDVHLLKIDASGGAYDISYDAWNYLATGESATVSPIAGGGIPATYEDVPMSECSSLIKTADGKLPLTAANSMNFVASCPAGTWVGDNYSLFNIANPCCTLGFDEICTLDMSVSNQPSCPHMLGLQNPLTVANPVMNIAYPSGQLVAATQ